MNPDLNKISCKKPGKNLPPKPKYVIETNQIKRIIQGQKINNLKIKVSRKNHNNETKLRLAICGWIFLLMIIVYRVMI